ncbi:hypothetical protein ILYODFUR_030316 [Ilyodon furcidens]|uniref:Uncharacterized protein n=1 Tax=Ilyodon furcidens TaxID=33524 RepID=A0ABV0UZL2_9TELE
MLVDGSTSITREDFGNIKLFLTEIVKNIHIDPNSVQIGLTQYSSTPKTEWDLNSYKTKTSLLMAINNIRQLWGTTKTGRALNYILHRSFKPNVGMRADSKKIAVLITDGESADDVMPPAKNLKDTGIEIYVIGMGDYVNIPELQTIASGDDKTHLFLFSNYESLYSVNNNITSSLCHSDTATDSVRLVNGTSLCSGRLEVKYSQSDNSNQIWSSVCEADFDQTDAEVVCKEIGCGPPLVLQGVFYGEVEASKWTKEFQCGGTESALLDCRRSGSVRNICSSGKVVGLTCSEPVRLVGGASRCEGILEVKLGTWRPVNALGWTMQEGAAACGELDCGSVVSMETRIDYSVRPVWEIQLSCFKSGSPLRECASLSSSQSCSVLELVCTDLLFQPIISVSSKAGVTHSLNNRSAGVFQGSSFTISCSIQPQYPGGSFQLSLNSSNTTHSYTQLAINHSAHFLFPAAEPAHIGSYICVYNVYVFFHDFSSKSHPLTLTVSDPTVFIIRLVLLLSLLLFISLIYSSLQNTRRKQMVPKRKHGAALLSPRC